MDKNTTLKIVAACIVILCYPCWVHAVDSVIATLLVPNTILQGEPLPVTIQVKNTSQKHCVILIPIIRRFGPDTVMFSIKNPDSSDFKRVQRPDIYFGGLKMRSPGMLTVKRVSPGEVAVYSFALVYDFPDVERRKRLFDTPGRYSIQATVFELVDPPNDANVVPYDARRRAVLTESADVEIVPPKSRREKDALHALWNLPDEYLIYEPSTFRPDSHAEAAMHLREYFRKYADTDLGRRAALPLGIAVAEGVVSDDSGAIRKAVESMSRDKHSQLRATASAVLEKMAKRGQ